MSTNLKPHRGGMILAFGILGWLVCFPLAIAAWVMGNTDIRAMDAGRMDPDGRGLTQAGKILGIVWVVVAALSILMFGALMAMGVGIGILESAR